MGSALGVVAGPFLSAWVATSALSDTTTAGTVEDRLRPRGKPNRAGNASLDFGEYMKVLFKEGTY